MTSLNKPFGLYEPVYGFESLLIFNYCLVCSRALKQLEQRSHYVTLIMSLRAKTPRVDANPFNCAYVRSGSHGKPPDTP